MPVSCRVCDCKRKHEHSLSTNDKFFVCPNHTFVESFLKDTVEFEAHLESDDLLCFRCYKYVMNVLKSDICTLSSEEIQVKLESKQRHLEDFTENFIVDSANGDYDKGEQHVQFALNKAALHVCKIVRLDKAILP